MNFKDLVVGMDVVVTEGASWSDDDDCSYPTPPVGTVLTVTSIDNDGSIDFRVTYDGDDNYLMNTEEVEPVAV